MDTTAKEIRVGDIGTVFEITLTEDGSVVPIGTATLLQIKFKSPLTTVTKVAVMSTDGSDGKLRYTSVLDDINVRGDWKLQAYIEMPVWQGHSSIGEYEVFPNL